MFQCIRRATTSIPPNRPKIAPEAPRLGVSGSPNRYDAVLPASRHTKYSAVKRIRPSMASSGRPTIHSAHMFRTMWMTLMCRKPEVISRVPTAPAATSMPRIQNMLVNDGIRHLQPET